MEVHGISNEMLADKPLFEHIAEEFLAFVEGAELVIHNAPFDIGFINHELSLLSGPVKDITRICTVKDSLMLARAKHPGQKNNLDALCKRYGVDNTQRELHGARSEEHTSELQSRGHLVCRLLLEKKKDNSTIRHPHV